MLTFKLSTVSSWLEQKFFNSNAVVKSQNENTSCIKMTFKKTQSVAFSCLACHGAGGGGGTAVEAQARVGSADGETLRGASCGGQVLLLDLQVGPAFHCWRNSRGLNLKL